jgi:hypothetical protein
VMNSLPLLKIFQKSYQAIHLVLMDYWARRLSHNADLVGKDIIAQNFHLNLSNVPSDRISKKSGNPIVKSVHQVILTMVDFKNKQHVLSMKTMEAQATFAVSYVAIFFRTHFLNLTEKCIKPRINVICP